jgi:fructokinase
VLCFGEVLWDCLPAGLFLGGAPGNVAYHLKRHGCEPYFASAVGNDFLGDEIRRRAAGWGLSTDLLATVENAPTGVVQVDATSPTKPVYTIVDNVAWDQIPATVALLDGARSADAVVFGTLALRHGYNRATLDGLLAETQALRVLDINLRPPFTAPDVLDFALTRADILKLNDQEIAGVGSPEPSVGELPALAESWAMRYDLKAVCVTCGAHGAGLWSGGEWNWVDGRVVTVKDTVGAGDAFLAALLAGLLRGDGDKEALIAACRTGEFVASRDGATPAYDAADILG